MGELEQSVATAERLAQSLHVNLIHLRDRPVTGSSTISSRQESANSESGRSGVELSGSHPVDPSSPDDTSRGQPIPSSKSAERRRRKQNSSSSITHSPSGQRQSPACTSPVQNQLDNPDSLIPLGTSATSAPVVREYLIRKEIPADDFVDVR